MVFQAHQNDLSYDMIYILLLPSLFLGNISIILHMSYLMHTSTVIYWQGAVGLRIRVYDRIMCFVNCHFAAHLDAVNRRNADFDHVYRTMTFSRPSNISSATAGMMSCLYFSCTIACSMYLFWLVYRSGLPLVLSVAAGASSAVQMLRGPNVCIHFLVAASSHFLKVVLQESLPPFSLMLYRLLAQTLWKRCLTYLKLTWSYFLVILIIGSMEYHLTKQGILFPRDVLIGSEKKISSE